MASSSSAADNPGKRGRGRPRKDAQAPAALQEAAQDECVDSLLSMIAEAEVPESASKEKNKPEKHNVKKDKKERKVDEDKDKTVKDKKNAKSSKKETEQEREKKPSLPGNYEWPADPVMEKLTVEGALCDDMSRLRLSAYTDLRKWFQGEPSENKHPDPKNPGLRKEELPGGSAAISLEGLTNWSDDKGAGWRTVRKAVQGKNKTESRWFGANSWGSWRMAFLLARLQHQVWKAAAAKRPSAAEPSSAEPSSAEPSSAVEAEGGAPVEEQVLGQEPWRDFTPKSIDSTKCLARIWNDGFGGQCDADRPKDNKLCWRHQRLAVSKQGLIYGLADGPIPEHRLRQFQAAVVKGTSGGRKRPAPEVETAKKSDDPRGKRRKLTKAKAAESEKAKVAKDEKGLESKAKIPKDAKDVPLQHTKQEAPPPPRVRRRVSTKSGRVEDSTLPPQKLADLDQFRTAEKKAERRGRRKKTDDASQRKVAPEEPDLKQQGEVRSRRLLQNMSKAEKERRKQDVWTTFDDAMDQAVNQIDSELQAGPFDGLLNDKGCIPVTGMAKTVQSMRSTPLHHRLQFSMILRKTMLENPQTTTAFMNAGGVGALRQWLQEALLPGQATSRQQEAVVLETLDLLHLVPVTLPVLQSTGIGSTLVAIRHYVAPAMADAGELVAKWMKKFSRELKSKPKAPQPMSSASSFASSASSSRAPPSPRPAAAPVMPAPAPAPRVSTPPKRMAFTMRMKMRKQERLRNAQNEVEATLRELFKLGQVLEEEHREKEAPQKGTEVIENIDLRYMDID
ncbi:unnamed protein product [Durusdinium trenchii]|uniref:TFIIS N-terminal domain-containing protein n=1 Tax=Durusdinium trenchii TaxID=1381693 RepID=A0ABP0QPA0_9DINO